MREIQLDSKLKYYIHKAKTLPPDVMIKKSFSEIKGRTLGAIEKIYVNVFGTKITDEEFLEIFCNSEYRFHNLEELQRHYRQRREPKFFIGPTQRDKIVKIIQNSFPESIKRTVKDADQICDHVFDLLGSGPTKLKNQKTKFNKENRYKSIDWHVDFKTGYKWNPKKYYRSIRIPNAYGKADIKVPWELSRFQHLATLGKAYWIVQKSEDKEKYAFEFMDQIEDWIENNSYKFGVNWKCAMDVAIRAVNWIFGFYFFADEKKIPGDFWIKFLKSLFLHGKFISSNLETGLDDRGNTITSNHYLSDVVGLIFLGIFFKETKEGNGWLDFGIEELMANMEFQVYPDGVDFESSIPYHRLVLELFTTSAILCKVNNIDLSQKFRDRLEKMFEFVMYYTKPDGNVPQIGDNDDGRLHIFANYGNWNRLDHRYLLSIGATLFDRLDFKEAAGGMDEEAFGLLGEEGLERYNAIGKKSLVLNSKAFIDGGFYIMRHNDLYLIVDCIPNDLKTTSGHKHNSRLSFELYACNKSFLIDPGTYTYTASPEWRNKFRSTFYHNTITVDGKEQSDFIPKKLFYIKSDTVIKVDNWKITDEYDFLDAQHSGYERLTNPVIHQRQIFFDKKDGYWIIKDILTGKGKHIFDLYFHFAPMKVDRLKTNNNVLSRVSKIKNQLIDGEIMIDSSLVVETKNNDGVNLSIIPLNTKNLTIDVLDGWVSCSYGVKEKASIVKYSKVACCPTEFLTILYPSLMN